MRAESLIISIALLVLLALPSARAEEIPESALVPIIVVQVEGPLSGKEVDALAEGLGAPHARGSELLGRLGLVTPLEKVFFEDVGARFKKASDDFFKGSDYGREPCNGAGQRISQG